MAEPSFENLPAVMERGVEREMRTKSVQVPAILESIEIINGQPRGVVYKKDDEDVQADEIPIFSLVGGDQYGHEPALHPEEEGVMFCADYPLEESLAEEGPTEEFRQRRHLAFQDGIFLAGMRVEEERGLNSAEDEDLWRPHPPPAGTERQITPEGEVHWRTNNEASDIQDGEGPEATERTHFGMGLDGHIPFEGIASFGREAAPRWDPSNLEAGRIPDGSELRDVEVNEPAEPITDPTAEANVNPLGGRLYGRLDCGFFELSNSKPPEFEADPDPAAPPGDPAYIPLDELPVPFQFYNSSEDAYKVVKSGGTIVELPV